MDIKLPTARLTLGMFVRGLDRPWTDTAFAFQGFLLRRWEHLEKLKAHCEHVWVDVDRSRPGVVPPDLVAEAEIEGAGDIELLSPDARQAHLLAIRSRFHDSHALRDTLLYEYTAPLEQEKPRADEIHGRAAEVVRGIMECARSDLAVQMPRAHGVVKNMVGSMIRNPKAMMWFARLRDLDDYTYRHLVDNAIYLIAFGRHLGFAPPVLCTLGMAGLLADLGKLGLPAELLHHRGTLSAEQYDQVKQHVRLGLDMLYDSGAVPSKVLEIVSLHHERFDGSGYPSALQGESIGMFGAMAGIVDAYTAMTANRPYAPAATALHALTTLYRSRDTLFPAALIEQFIQTVGVYPVGCLVELSTGQVGIVVEENRTRRLMPKLMLVRDAAKRPCEAAVLNLMDEPRDQRGEPIIVVRELAGGEFGIRLQDYFQ